LRSHRTQSMRRYTPCPFDLIVGFEPWHATTLRERARNTEAQVTLLGLWCREPRPYIHDPFQTQGRYVETCLARIDDGLESIERFVRTS
jgi:protein-tyrosine phosphatase